MTSSRSMQALTKNYMSLMEMKLTLKYAEMFLGEVMHRKKREKSKASDNFGMDFSGANERSQRASSGASDTFGWCPKDYRRRASGTTAKPATLQVPSNYTLGYTSCNYNASNLAKKVRDGRSSLGEDGRIRADALASR